MINALCIDVDDLGGAFYEQGILSDSGKVHVDYETHQVLDHLDTLNVKATFFVPGYTSKHVPKLVKDICDRGHELACHGDVHCYVDSFDAVGFAKDVKVSKERLEDLSGAKVDMYKAPAWSITPSCLWAYDVLVENGFRVDHSAMPATKRALGQKAERHMPFDYNGLLVIPPSSLKFLGKVIPVPGGFYNAYMPVWLQLSIASSYNTKGFPYNYYFHPFEHSPHQDTKALAKTSVHTRLYSNHAGVFRSHLEALCEKLEFSTLSAAYKEYLDE